MTTINTTIVARPPESRSFLLIGCEVLFREACLLSAQSPHKVDHRWLSQGLHDLGPERMVARLQEEIDSVPEGAYDAILLGFALCNNGVVGLKARHTPLIIPRAHDCISFFLGSRQRYQDYFDTYPGTYFLTTGWIERDESRIEGETSVADRMGLAMSMEEIVAQYGEENAEYIASIMGNMTQNYSRLAYIDMGLPCEAPLRALAEAEAAKRGWEFEILPGDLDLLRRLLAGDWDEDYLRVEPGQAISPTHDVSILRSCACCP